MDNLPAHWLGVPKGLSNWYATDTPEMQVPPRPDWWRPTVGFHKNGT
jgi:hypothetical protein